jgi:hypothetical protein
MTSHELKALKEFATLFRAQRDSYDKDRQPRMAYLFQNYTVCKQAVLRTHEIVIEGPRSAELEEILKMIHPERRRANS